MWHRAVPASCKFLQASGVLLIVFSQGVDAVIKITKTIEEVLGVNCLLYTLLRGTSLRCICALMFVGLHLTVSACNGAASMHGLA